MTKISLALSSCISRIAEVEEYVHMLSSQYKISNDKFPDILISLTEAVNNAIIHGNQKDIQKQVFINSIRNPTGLEIAVSDEGLGFDPGSIPDPTCDEHIHNCGGRGVFLMQQLSDRVSFEDNGRTVRLFFQL